MKIWKLKKILNEVIIIGFMMFVLLTWLDTTKKEDLIIVTIFAVSYTAAKIKATIEKEKRFKSKKFKNKKFSKKNKESE